jgi:hypothetical protein
MHFFNAHMQKTVGLVTALVHTNLFNSKKRPVKLFVFNAY